ncbi:MAG: hypothetical protein R8K22_05855 [Mariprofundaceae bacterium]
MRQQRLEFHIPNQNHYGQWIRHAGVETASARIALWLVQGGMLWLSSNQAAGKSSFLHVLSHEHSHVGIVSFPDQPLPALKLVESWLQMLNSHVCWVIDLPAGPLSPAVGFAVFHMIERAKEMNRPLLISWRCEACDLAPPELSSRLHMFERAEMESPRTDSDLKAVLVSVAQGLQWQVKESLLHVIMFHFSRSLEDQVHALRQLDAASLEERARLTQAWAKAQLQEL